MAAALVGCGWKQVISRSDHWIWLARLSPAAPQATSITYCVKIDANVTIDMDLPHVVSSRYIHQPFQSPDNGNNEYTVKTPE